MDTVTATSGLADLSVESVADADAMRLAFEWADACPEDRGYPHLIASFLSMLRAIETVQRGRRE